MEPEQWTRESETVAFLGAELDQDSASAAVRLYEKRGLLLQPLSLLDTCARALARKLEAEPGSINLARSAQRRQAGCGHTGLVPMPHCRTQPAWALPPHLPARSWALLPRRACSELCSCANTRCAFCCCRSLPAHLREVVFTEIFKFSRYLPAAAGAGEWAGCGRCRQDALQAPPST